MAIYDFDSIVERRGTACVKWDAPNGAGVPSGDVIPMWVADMDFRTAPCIIEALRRRVEHGVFGYTAVPESYYSSVISWFRRRRGWEIERDWIIYTTAVVPALSVCIKAFTEPGDKVVFLTPAYNCFFSSVRNAGCVCSESKLIYTHDGSTISVSINWEDLEGRCRDTRAKVLLLCNPHNPTGRIWSRDELTRLGDIARRHGLVVLSDEIHCELEIPGHVFTPFAAVSDENLSCCVTMNSPSKSFNTASLQIANIISSNPEWRRRIDKVINIYEVCDVGPFGVAGLEAAYNEGEPWLKELNSYIWQNYCDLRDLFARELPQCGVVDLQGTYLAWVDVSAIGLGSEELVQSLILNEHVRPGSGALYGDDAFLRINLACPRSLCQEGLRRIVTGLKRIIG
ncbi:MAG: pyridoxal phosphate-dependent aminotransferase [Bacteroidales bacterium]|nr:pyridoxal phosphate-dependent aminotransferase [Bacteroidales bacterium]